MDRDGFVDHYEILQLSQNADTETVERVFRMLAKRFHPDNARTGDAATFREIKRAYEVLSDPERRAKFDVRYDDQKSMQWRIFEQGAAADAQEQDQRIFDGVLSLLYAAKRKDPDEGGLGQMYLEKMLGVPREHLAFPLWYLKERGWIEILDSGRYAITVEGVDETRRRRKSMPESHLLGDGSLGNRERQAASDGRKAGDGRGAAAGTSETVDTSRPFGMAAGGG